MAYFSMHAYDADVWVPEFRGLNQADIMLNPDVRYAAEEQNVETPHGVLQPMAANEVSDGPMDSGGNYPRVEMIAALHRRWYTGAGSHTFYICCAGGHFYQRQQHGANWLPIDMPTGVTDFISSAWSWVTYEYTPQGADTPVDIMLVSNAYDGMFSITPPEHTFTWGDAKAIPMKWSDVQGKTWGWLTTENWVMTAVDTKGKLFGVIERYAERVWGSAIKNEPDMMMYSAVYAPTDWNAYPYPNASNPDAGKENAEDGAGDIMQPSWDGDSFNALRQFGNHLLAFKKNKIWKIMGVSPGEFTVSEQYGRGTEFYDTIATHGERVYMCGRDGILVYDGMNTTNLGQNQIEQIWRTANQDALDQMCAVVYENRYYLAFPVNGSTVNNALMVVELDTGNFLYYPDLYIEAFMPANDILYATSSQMPGKVIWMKRDSWVVGEASGEATKWVTPWMDFGYKRIQKGGFDFYFLPEVQNEAVTFSISIQTEKKRKTKQYTCQPLTDEQRAVPKEHRVKRLHFGGMGRKFRIIVETASGVTAPWRIIGGLHLVVETDPD